MRAIELAGISERQERAGPDRSPPLQKSARLPPGATYLFPLLQAVLPLL